VELIANMRERRVQVWVSELDTKRLLVRPRCRWEDNTKMVLQEVDWGRGMDLSASGQGQVVCSIKFWELLD
jgi:hypothetical protein